jgi:hypothetical protein
VIAYHVILRRQPSHELGEDDLHRLEPEARATRLVRQLGRLGFDVARHQRMERTPLVAEVTLLAGS